MIPIFRPTIKRKDMDSVLHCMVSDLIGPGNIVQEFESMLAQYIGAETAIAYCSYYLAIRYALDALELEPGAHVLISALSPAIYRDIIIEKGLVPPVVDVNVDSGIIEPAEIEKVLSSNPKALLYHYTLGFLPLPAAILKFNIPVIEDISHCFGASAEKKFFGTFGELAVLSLNQENIITTAAGGVIFARDKKMGQKIRSMQIKTQGDLLLADLNASLGISQIKMLPALLEKRKNIHTVYKQALMKSRYKTLLQQEEYECTPYSFPVMISSGLKEVQKYCKKKNIETVQAFTTALIAVNEEIQNTCKNAKTLFMCTLLFPLYPTLGKDDINNIAKVIGTIP